MKVRLDKAGEQEMTISTNDESCIPIVKRGSEREREMEMGRQREGGWEGGRGKEGREGRKEREVTLTEASVKKKFQCRPYSVSCSW